MATSLTDLGKQWIQVMAYDDVTIDDGKIIINSWITTVNIRDEQLTNSG